MVGILYAQKQGKLKQYASTFPTAEIDSTFYRFPEPGTVLGWARQMHFSSVARSVLHTNFDGAVKRFMPTYQMWAGCILTPVALPR